MQINCLERFNQERPFIEQDIEGLTVKVRQLIDHSHLSNLLGRLVSTSDTENQSVDAIMDTKVKFIEKKKGFLETMFGGQNIYAATCMYLISLLSTLFLIPNFCAMI